MQPTASHDAMHAAIALPALSPSTSLSYLSQIVWRRVPHTKLVSATFPLWPEGHVPIHGRNASHTTESRAFHGPCGITWPTLTAYRPERAGAQARTAIVIMPGGEYKWITWKAEGPSVARYLCTELGVTSFVLKYRTDGARGVLAKISPDSTAPLPWGLVPLQDAQRAMRIIRSRSQALAVDPTRIGTLGFSAGGHLVAHLGWRYTQSSYHPVDGIDQESCRPDFSLVIYPFAIFKNTSEEAGESAVDCLYLTTRSCPLYGPLGDRAPDPDQPPTFIAQELDDRGARDAMALYSNLQHVEHVQRRHPSAAERDTRKNQLHVFASVGSHGTGTSHAAAILYDTRSVDVLQHLCLQENKTLGATVNGEVSGVHLMPPGVAHGPGSVMREIWPVCAAAWMRNLGVLETKRETDRCSTLGAVDDSSKSYRSSSAPAPPCLKAFESISMPSKSTSKSLPSIVSTSALSSSAAASSSISRASKFKSSLLAVSADSLLGALAARIKSASQYG